MPCTAAIGPTRAAARFARSATRASRAASCFRSSALATLRPPQRSMAMSRTHLASKSSCTLQMRQRCSLCGLVKRLRGRLLALAHGQQAQCRMACQHWRMHRCHRGMALPLPCDHLLRVKGCTRGTQMQQASTLGRTCHGDAARFSRAHTVFACGVGQCTAWLLSSLTAARAHAADCHCWSASWRHLPPNGGQDKI